MRHGLFVQRATQVLSTLVKADQYSGELDDQVRMILSDVMSGLCSLAYSALSHYVILYYTTLYYNILYYTILYYTILYYTILYYTIL